jgi:hypothetical protein
MRRLFALFLSVLLSTVTALSLLAVPGAFAHAQTAAYAEITSINADGFPRVTALVDVFHANGQFLTGLKPSDITLYEDSQQRTVDSLTEALSPVQLVVAINPGPALAIKDGSGAQRIQRVIDALNQWVTSQPDDQNDDLSLISLSGSLISHANAHDWAVSLNSFKPDFRNTVPNLQTLAIALDTVSGNSPQPGMKRAVLFITPHIDDTNIDNSIAPLIKRAIDSKIRVFVWFIDAENLFPSASANAFKSITQQSGGSYFAFSSSQPFPDLNSYFTPLRAIYALTYTSTLSTSGDHSLGMYVDTPDGQIPALDKTFNVNIQPPNPIFVSPPLQITRQPPKDDPYNTKVMVPARQNIEIIIDFPDEHRRDLKRTTLYVDGQVADENKSAPFDKFTWDLSLYRESSQHEIVVEAEDRLGLKKSSLGIPVMITVIQPPRGVTALLARYRSYLVLGAIGLAGLALLAILIRGWVGNRGSTPRQEKKKRFEDPVTQPVVALTETANSAKKRSKTQPRRTSWIPARPTRMPEAPAYLIRLTNGGEPASATPIPVSEKDMTFGTDPVQSIRVLDDPSISPLHARIKRMDDGVFVIYDHGSIAGTWVNYEPVTREGTRLAHGDRIHFGQMVYRFNLSQPPAESEPKVITKK